MPLSEFVSQFPGNKKRVVSQFEMYSNPDLKYFKSYFANSKTANGTRFSITAYFYSNRLVYFEIDYIDIVLTNDVVRQLEIRYGDYQFYPKEHTIKPGSSLPVETEPKYIWDRNAYKITLREKDNWVKLEKTSPRLIKTIAIEVVFLDKILYQRVLNDQKIKKQGLID